MSSSARVPKLLLAPENDEDKIIVSRRKLGELVQENDQLREKVSEQSKEIAERTKEIERLRKGLEEKTQAVENAAHEAQALRGRLEVHENPNVPPSVRNTSPGYARDRELKAPEKHKKPGGRRGHPGVTRAPLEPNAKVDLTSLSCGRCGSRRLEPRGTDTKTQIELPPPRDPIITEYTVHVYGCLDCGEEVRSTLPDGSAPAEYGPRLQSEVVVGKIEERLPYRKLQARLARQRIPMCPATLQAVVWGASDKLGGEEAAILQRIRKAEVVHADETSFRVHARGVSRHRWWCWVFCTTEGDVLIVLRPSRDRDVVKEVLGPDFHGRLVCDGWKAYLGWLLQRCWAHLLRVAEAWGKKSEGAKEMSEALHRAYRRMTRGLERAGKKERARRLRWGTRFLSKLIGRWEGVQDRGVQKVVTYLRNGESFWLTFLAVTGVEPTNNRGERALREAVVIRKIIGALRSVKGAGALGRLLSVLGTWKAKGEDLMAKLYEALGPGPPVGSASVRT